MVLRVVCESPVSIAPTVIQVTHDDVPDDEPPEVKLPADDITMTCTLKIGHDDVM